MTRRSISHILFLFLAIVGIFCIFTVFRHSKYPTSLNVPSNNATILDDGWYVINRNSSQEISLPYKISNEESSITLYHSYDQVFKDAEYISIFAPRQYIELYYDGVQIFHSNMVLPFDLEEIASFYHVIPLPKNRNVKTVKLLVRPYSDRYRQLITAPYIGSFAEFFEIILQQNIENLIFGSIVFVCGLLFLFLFFLLRKDLKGNHTLSALGIFALLLSLWIIFESTFIQFLLPNPTLCILIKYLSQLFIVPTVLIFFMNLIKNDSSSILFLFFISLINIAIVLILQITGLSNFQDSIFTTHLGMLIISLTVILYFESCPKEKKQELKTYLPAFYCLIIGTVLEITIYYVNSHSVSFLIQFFITLFVILFGRSLTLKTLAFIQESKQAEYYKNLAYMDTATGTFNRTAYHSFIEKYTEQGQQWSIIIFDLNNLKQINDTMGHMEGDHLINGFCHCAQIAFKGFGVLYRIGGDEFVCLCKNTSENHVIICLQELETLLSTYGNIPISHSYGCDFFTPTKPSDFKEALKRADVKMYEMKRNKKANQR